MNATRSQMSTLLLKRAPPLALSVAALLSQSAMADVGNSGTTNSPQYTIFSNSNTMITINDDAGDPAFDEFKVETKNSGSGTTTLIRSNIDATTISSDSLNLRPTAIQGTEIEDASVDTVDLADFAVNSSKIADGAIGTAKILDNTISNSDINNTADFTMNSVSTAAGLNANTTLSAGGKRLADCGRPITTEQHA